MSRRFEYQEGMCPSPVALALCVACCGAPGEPGADIVPDLFERAAAALELGRREAASIALDPRGLRDRLRERHARALGVPLVHAPAPVEHRTLATLERDGYVLRKIAFVSRPGVTIPALLYTPAGLAGKAPAVLNVHGHWSEAKRAPQVHGRCVFLVRRGFVALALDAIGAGERAYQGIGYHGRQLGYQVLPSGLTLAGLQVLDNRRAIDLLASLPEVDGERIGVTGASGGGNQTFHLAILDERVRAAVGVCFFGAFHGYVRGAHCACELVPGALTYAEEGVLAGCAAPRALMIIAAREDQGAAFRIDDARANAALARRLYGSLGGDFELREFDGGHDYSRPMREAMVAYFEHHLQGKPRLERVEEPPLDLLGPGELFVLDGKPPPDDRYVPDLAAQAAREAIDGFRAGPRWQDATARPGLRARLAAEVLGGLVTTLPLRAAGDTLETEPGVLLPLRTIVAAPAAPEGILVCLGAADPALDAAARTAAPPAWSVLGLEPRGVGRTRWPAASTVGCEDYLLAQGSAVLGRPVLGQWAGDALRAVEHLVRRHPRTRIALFGEGALALAAILAGALDDRIDAVGAVNFLSSYVWPDRCDDAIGLATFVPGILRLGDVADWCGALAGRRLVIAGPRDGAWRPLSPGGLESFLHQVGDGGAPAPAVAADRGQALEHLLAP